ncbi:Hypothetical protein CINCED_3A023095 [Cinara cedri]|uniref:ATP-dependent DNA helicase n=1 Tax=Cinara cedri TaxID=506608 RepID=A0A5E4NJE0_9HEMI|nr:Hypothetical protein CINCED_3A023095 [Cinara cedri]
MELDEEDGLFKIEQELKEINAKINKLQKLKTELLERKEKLKQLSYQKQTNSISDQKKWTRTDFPWQKSVEKTLKTVFKLDKFRSQQLAAINITLSKHDAILIMPTGGGKSLCYQLPALIDPGFTLVVSPMVSLMEDQIIQLYKLNVNAKMISSNSTKEETKLLFQMMIDVKSGLKLVYCTPERIAKSKTFMNKLQKAHSLKLLSRIAIDEVHCCTTWGHDFRPDYTHLTIFKPMFPEIPILGLTATASSKVIIDTQELLQIQGCALLKSSFNRPNLYYEVRWKPDGKKCVDELASLLKNKFKNQSGIIYTTSIKDCESLRKDLRCRRTLIASHFDESWESTDCNAMCDNCSNSKIIKSICINKYCMDIYKILNAALDNDTKFTAQMLLDTWFGKGSKKIFLFDVKSPEFSRTQAEMILGELIVQGYLSEDFHYTPYSTISYIKKGSNQYKVTNDNTIFMEMTQEKISEPVLKKLKLK